MVASVISTVYNQAPYVAQMIESVLCQKTDFYFEFIIANDCSTDNSAEIIKSYAQNDSRIVFLDNPKNLGVSKNYVQCFELAKGKYIAGLGGDDYWIDENKLQMQVDFLEKNKDYGVVHTQYDALYMKKRFFHSQYVINALPPEKQIEGDVFYDMIIENRMMAITKCNVRSIIQESGVIEKLKNGEYFIEDLPIGLAVARRSKVGFINKSTVCYRIWKNSSSNFKDIDKQIQFYQESRKIALSFLKEEEKELPKIKHGFEQRDCINYTYWFSKKNDFENYKKYYEKLENKILDRKVRYLLLYFRLGFLFNMKDRVISLFRAIKVRSL